MGGGYKRFAGTATIFSVERLFMTSPNRRSWATLPVAHCYVARWEILNQKTSSWPSRDRTPETILKTYELFIYVEIR